MAYMVYNYKNAKKYRIEMKIRGRIPVRIPGPPPASVSGHFLRGAQELGEERGSQGF